MINKRTEKDIWENLYEFYLFESDKEPNWQPLIIDKWLREQLGIENYLISSISTIYKQQLTHQNLQGRFIEVRLQAVPLSLRHFTALKTEDLSVYAFPKFINQYLLDKRSSANMS